MTYINWQTTGSNEIEPESNKDIVPNGTASLGLLSDPWKGLFIDETASINVSREDHGPVLIVYGDSSSSDAQVLIGATSTGHRVFIACAALSSTGTDARTIMAQENDEAGIPVVSFKQRDESEAFIDLEGAYDSTAAKSITTGNGNGSVVGPKAKNTADYGFEYAGMFMVRTDIGNGLEDLWTPLYRKVTS